MADEEPAETVVFRLETGQAYGFRLKNGRVDVDEVLTVLRAVRFAVREANGVWMVAKPNSKIAFPAGSEYTIRVIGPPAFNVSLQAATNITAEAVDAICSRYWQRIVSRLPLMKKKEDFKRVYRRSRAEIYCVDDRPTLLLQGLDKGERFKASQRLQEELEQAQPRACYLVNASGSGKTRTLYELASDRLCVYLVGAPVKGISHLEGSKDLLAVSHKLQALYPNNQEIPVDALDCCLSALFIARLYILMHASRNEEFDLFTWLFRQVYFSRLNYPNPDPWLKLTVDLLNLLSSVRDVPIARDIFGQKLRSLMDDVEWDQKKGIVILDECQEVSKYLEGRMLSSDQPVVGKSMLDTLFSSLENIGFARQPFLMAGTRGFLMRLYAHSSECAKDRLSLLVYSDFGSWTSVDQLEEYTRSLVADTTDFDFKRIFAIYVGRYRFYVTALQRFLRKSETDNRNATEFIMDFALQLATLPGRELNINRSVFDDVKNFLDNRLNAESWHVVKTLVLLYFFGLAQVSVVVKDSDLGFIQAGLGRIVKQKPESAYHFDIDVFPWNGPRSEGVNLGEVTLGEPIVARALWEYMHVKRDVLIGKFAALGSSVDSGELGKEYELFTVESLGKLLHGNAPAALVSERYQSKIRPIYKEAIELVHMGEFGLVERMIDASSMLRWLSDFEAVLRGERRKTFRPYLHSGKVTELGPDLMCGFRGQVRHADGSVETLPVMALFWHKVRKEIDLNHAFNTLDVEQLFLHRGATKAETSSGRMHRNQEEEAAVQKLKELCDRGGLLKLVVASATDITERHMDNVFAAAGKKRYYESLRTSSGALVGVIHSKVQFMEPEDVHVMEAVKILKRKFTNRE